jgi:DeoR family transcriptional regulator, fructose operon transcriptional repressor
VRLRCGYDLARFGGLSEVAMLITDSGLDVDVAARLEAAGPRVVRA